MFRSIVAAAIVFVMLLKLSIIGGLLWVVWHFASKYW